MSKLKRPIVEPQLPEGEEWRGRKLWQTDAKGSQGWTLKSSMACRVNQTQCRAGTRPIWMNPFVSVSCNVSHCILQRYRLPKGVFFCFRLSKVGILKEFQWINQRIMDSLKGEVKLLPDSISLTPNWRICTCIHTQYIHACIRTHTVWFVKHFQEDRGPLYHVF